MQNLNGWFRLLAYWLVTASALLTTVFLYVYGTTRGRNWFRTDLAEPLLLEKYEIRGGTGAVYICLTSPLIVVGSLCLLIVTKEGLPMSRTTWLIRPIQQLRTIVGEGKRRFKNQFGMGDHHMVAFFVFFVFLPIMAYLMANIERRIIAPQEDPKTVKDNLTNLSDYCGIVGSFALSFFLIPAARHNILLTAVGWSPVHALRLHVLSGYFSFAFIMLHGLLYVVDMFAFGEGSIIDQAIPDAKCWKWKPVKEEEGHRRDDEDSCELEWWFFTGFISGFAFIALVATSFNWFRRRFYRAFYICHVIFGPLMLIMGVMHWRALVYYIAPSILYYVASTTPVLIQALASRFRGGVKITQVNAIKDAGGCVEVSVATGVPTDSHMDSEACMFVRLCAPGISLVWHPFTVFKHPSDTTTVRFLMRPVGPFTKELASRLVAKPSPILILDGLYRGGDRIQEALCHDVVSIVCGGVAITPFLSMIPNLLHAVKRQGSGTIKKLVVHWACREKGLATFVTRNYLNAFHQLAAEVKSSCDFEMDIVIYHTSPLIAKQLAAEEVTDYDVVLTKNERDDTDTHSDDSVNKLDKTTDISGVGHGHSMELARFMPAVHSSMARNVPHFIMMGGSLWIGFMIMHHFYQNYEFTVLENLTYVWSSIVWVLASIALAIIFEFLFLFLFKHIPDEKPETYDVKSLDDTECGTLASSAVHQYRRPEPLDIFGDLASAECPGLFLCGPPGLTKMVRREAALENSHFGLTRYAIYEEPFEM